MDDERRRKRVLCQATAQPSETPAFIIHFYFLKPVPAETGMPAWEQPSLPPCGAMHYRDIRKSYFMLTFQISASGPLYGVTFWKNVESSSTLLSYAYIFLRW